MRYLLVLLMVFAFAAIAAPARAQDGGVEVGKPGEEEQLQSGGGDVGTQFPQGTSNCSGDREHHAHDYPADPCVRRNNPHYATNMGGGEVCTQRAKHCSSCNFCCDKQKVEAENCHCQGDDYCEAQLDYVAQKCKENCTGHFLDACA